MNRPGKPTRNRDPHDDPSLDDENPTKGRRSYRLARRLTNEASAGLRNETPLGFRNDPEGDPAAIA
jgi:hypothetical protein